jgi:nucleoside-diphosphate-sugar epimerase
MSEERFLLTGAMGCIGAWVVRTLVREGVPVTVFDVASNPHRLKLIMSPEEFENVRFINGDITDLTAIEGALKDSGATHVIHLAALQVPFCRANPPLGAAVNVVGTVNMFEAVKRAGLRRLVFASSIAVYGRNEEYGEGPLPHDAHLNPKTHYGVYKQANEGTARVYWADDGISSIGLRPHTVYGPGRDQGMTSGPTKAMLAAAWKKPFHIPFGGRAEYQYAEDTARIFIQAARSTFEGADVFNLRGSVVNMQEIVDAIHAVEPEAQITFEPVQLPFPEETDDSTLVAAVGPVRTTPFGDGVAQTIDIFRGAIQDGRVSPDAMKL